MEPNEKPKLDITRVLITAAIVLAAAGIVGGTTWYVMDKSAREVQKANDESIAALQKQIDGQKATNTTPTTTPTTTVTVARTETETIITFCESGGSNYKVTSFQHVNNANGDFVLCKVGYTDGPTGFVIYGKKINNTWTNLFKGQENPSSVLANENKIPHELYMFSVSDDTRPDGVRNWKY